MSNITSFLGVSRPVLSTKYQHLDWQWRRSWERWAQLHDLGFNLVPAVPSSKTPLVKFGDLFERRQTRHEFESMKAERIGKVWSCNMLIITGSTPGIQLVALDPDDEAAESLFRSRCPESPMRTRTRRGFHRFFRHPGTGYLPQVISHTIGGVRYKIDRKADHNYVVAPGSFHESGHIYDWVEPWTPEMIVSLPVFDPAWLPDQGSSPKTTVSMPDHGSLDHDEACDAEGLPSLEDRIEAATRYVKKVPGTTEGHGTASNRCMWLAGKVAIGFLLPENEAVDVLMDHWADRPDQSSPWTDPEITHKVRSAIKQPSGYRGTPGDMLRDRLVDQERTLTRLVEGRPREDGDPRMLENAPPPRLELTSDLADSAGDAPRSPSPRQDEPCLDDAPVRQPASGSSRAARRGFNPSQIRGFSDPRWLVEDHVQEDTLACIFGAPGSFKSFYGYDMAFSIATGEPFLGHYKVEQGPVLYLYAEGRGGIRRRLLAWEEARGLILPDDRVCVVPYGFSFTGEKEETEKEVEELIGIATASLGGPPVATFVDTIARNFGAGDENVTRDMTGFIGVMDQIRGKTGGFVGLVHHTGKDKTKKERGSSVLRASADTLIEIDREDPESEIAVVRCEKQKDGEPFQRYQVAAEKVDLPGGGSIVLRHGGVPAAKGAKNRAERTKASDARNLQVFYSHRVDGIPIPKAATEWGVKTDAARKRCDDLHARELLERTKDGKVNKYHLSTRGYALVAEFSDRLEARG